MTNPSSLDVLKEVQVKIQVLSDLHLEFRAKVHRSVKWAYSPPVTEADVVVLAGDIHTKARGVRWAAEMFPSKPCIYVPGNHEYYSGSLGHTFQKLKTNAAGTSVHVLNDEELVIGDVRFLGCTLWTDYKLTGNEPLAQLDAQARMNDFKKVRDERFRKIRPNNLRDRHVRSRIFLQDALERPFAGKTVVVSHHAPCELSIHERYRSQPGHLSASFASRLERLMGDAVQLWIHGHTHDSLDYDMYGTRVLCNPRGYAPDELNPDFRGDLVVEV